MKALICYDGSDCADEAVQDLRQSALLGRSRASCGKNLRRIMSIKTGGML